MILKAYKEWLQDSNVNVLATVTLKQAYRHDFGFIPIQNEHITKTALILRDRFTKKVVGCSKFKKKNVPNYLSFREGEDKFKKYHLHILTVRPEHWDIDKDRMAFALVCQGLDWTRGQIDLRSLDWGYEPHIRTLSYCFKEGSDAWLPEASFWKTRFET